MHIRLGGRRRLKNQHYYYYALRYKQNHGKKNNSSRDFLTNNGILKAVPLVRRGAKPCKLPLIFTVYNRQSLDKQAAVKDNIMLAERHNYL